MSDAAVRPGFRRRFLIEPGDVVVTASLEDDFHHMTVKLSHDGSTISSVDGTVHRAPWTTCPSASAVLEDTFVGSNLADAARRGLKQANCTHLYDLAVLAAAHAADQVAIAYDLTVADPLAGEAVAEICRDGQAVHRWILVDDTLADPPEIAGKSLLQLREWIASLDTDRREAAKLLQWASLVAHGRQIPLEDQSDATRMPPNCYTFQPDKARQAKRVGRVIDFSTSDRQPLEPA